MRGNTFGKLFSITSFGESHGEALGVVIDGVPAGLNFNRDTLEEMLSRRAPGRKPGTTERKESDRPEILSGIYENKTLGSPIAVIVRNENQRSGDYDKLKDEYRPGHADKTTLLKYGIRDHRGGGRASGRETIARVIGAYFATLVLPALSITSEYIKVGELTSPNEDDRNTYLEKLKKQGESCGGVCEIRIADCPVGLGEPAFDKLKADLAKALMSIGGVVSFEYGGGLALSSMKGSAVSSDPQNFGGIEGGISNGDPIICRVAFKPTSTHGEKALAGRHDPCIMIRASVVLESMCYLVLADHYLRQKAYWL